MRDSKCIKCGCLLTGENWTKYLQVKHYHICKECYNKHANDYQRKNPEKLKIRNQKNKENFVAKYGEPEWKKRNNHNSKNWRHRNPEKDREYNRKVRHRITREVLTHYGGDPPKCVCCGESNIFFLSIDHINNNGAEHRKQIFGKYKFTGGPAFYYWLKKNNYPEEYQVLCFNCNQGKLRNKGICPHKKIEEW